MHIFMDLEELLVGQGLAALRGIVGEETPARHPSTLSPCPLEMLQQSGFTAPPFEEELFPSSLINTKNSHFKNTCYSVRWGKLVFLFTDFKFLVRPNKHFKCVIRSSVFFIVVDLPISVLYDRAWW